MLTSEETSHRWTLAFWLTKTRIGKRAQIPAWRLRLKEELEGLKKSGAGQARL